MFIGIDLGTSAVKLILVDAHGKVAQSVSKSYPLLMPQDGWTEQDPNLWFEKMIEGLRELVVGYEDQIKGVGFSGQMHGLVLLGDGDVLLRPAILWNDQRTAFEVNQLNQQIGITT